MNDNDLISDQESEEESELEGKGSDDESSNDEYESGMKFLS